MKIFVYPGSFDPVTKGHMDIIERASSICDKLIVAVLVNQAKSPVFSLEERVSLLRAAIGDNPQIEIASFSGLLVDFMSKRGATTIIKGLRAVSDFEYELQMAFLNKDLDSGIETLFMMAGIKYCYLSSSIVRELARNGAPIENYVPEGVSGLIYQKFGIVES